MLIGVFIFNRGKIGFGTVYCMVVAGYLSDGILWFIKTIPIFEYYSIQTRIISYVFGFITVYFGVAIYIETNMGVSAYDAVGITFVERIKKPHWFRWVRIFTDALCVIGGIITKSDVGIGTLLTVLLAGPLIAFYKNKLSKLKIFQFIEE